MNKLNVMNNFLNIKPYAPNLGAVITNIDLSIGISDAELKGIRDAFHKFQVLFFQNQSEISPENHIKLGKCFGDLHIHPAAPKMKNYPEIFEINTDKNSKIANGAEDFHSDVSCDIEPPLGTMLQLHVLPECGGDTMFANMYLAYEALSKPMQVFLGGLKAFHESEHFYKGRYQNKNEVDINKEYPSAIHPIIRTHPETEKKAIYVNKFFTTRIEGLADQESKLILDYLFTHIEKTEFQIRYKWNKNDMAFWDNRCTIHKALWDYFPNERKGRRVTIKGSVPY
ncbi:TauD/TfdA family dioxygenase [Alphaproteobacteria bacterium]|jgi:taurine dioxygenase|nr:TauD/TfdA family dioxygenase [Alphaproteobacteria bacterium]